jgi:glycosyltransferase involved in cell wall biosynthesis
MTRICHLSSAHRGLDVRIFAKECASLAAAGHDTHLVITATPADVQRAAEKGVHLHPLPAPVGRFARMVKQAWRCYTLGRRLNADVYHFHDSELIPYGVLLALAGKKVIYDVHEDLPQDILTKDWIPAWARRLVSGAASALEWVGARYFFAVVAATPFIARRFKKITPRTVDINNYPLLGELAVGPIDWSLKKREVCYVGGIGRIRGILEVVQAMGLTTSGARLQLGGTFAEPDVEATARAAAGWRQVDALGWIGRTEVSAILQRAVGGLVTFLPVPNHVDAQPNKMFEYMSAGVPVIASHFPLWKEIVEGNDCGICVDPLDPAAIARAIDYLVTHPQEAERMGRNGQRAVETTYNWGIEEAKLLRFYAAL